MAGCLVAFVVMDMTHRERSTVLYFLDASTGVRFYDDRTGCMMILDQMKIDLKKPLVKEGPISEIAMYVWALHVHPTFSTTSMDLTKVISDLSAKRPQTCTSNRFWKVQRQSGCNQASNS